MIQDLKEIEELLNDIDGKHIGFFDVKSELKELVKKVQTQALSIANVSNRLSKMEEAGKEATSLIAHLKDQHGFNDEEQASQDKIMDVFKYEGDW